MGADRSDPDYHQHRRSFITKIGVVNKLGATTHSENTLPILREVRNEELCPRHLRGAYVSCRLCIGYENRGRCQDKQHYMQDELGWHCVETAPTATTSLPYFIISVTTATQDKAMPSSIENPIKRCANFQPVIACRSQHLSHSANASRIASPPFLG